MLRRVTKAEKVKAEKSIRQVRGDESTICQHIRKIFFVAEKEVKPVSASKKIMEECRVIFSFAKRMNSKLNEYARANDDS